MRQAAQGEIVYNDDTTNRVLDLIKENKTKAEGERTGIFTPASYRHRATGK
jgi:hypothetical protein